MDEREPTGRYNLKELLEILCRRDGSDLHLTVGSPPYLRVDGELSPIEGPPLTSKKVQQLTYGALSEEQIHLFERDHELDFSFGIPGLSRFRANVFVQRESVALVIRRIPYEIPSFEELGLPPLLRDLSLLPSGLILVTGPTGSGKSTTLAAMTEQINRERRVHIVTIEDPVEFLYSHKRSLVNQRQVHRDTRSFSVALRNVLRQDPDVVLVGELRDPESISATLTIAETGHLVMTTLHTGACAQAIQRMVDVFPSHQRDQVRTQLSLCLQAVIAQQLLLRVGGGRVLALEIMLCIPGVRALIRENKVHQLYSAIQTGTKFGMRTMNQSLCELARTRQITQEEALMRTMDPVELQRLLRATTS